MSSFHSNSISHRNAAYRAPAPVSNAPAGTFAPGTRVQVGKHRIVIEKYLSEGGFAHVYLVQIIEPHESRGQTVVLKRVAVPDKDTLANMRTEVETMKRLKGHKYIVTYIEHQASPLNGGGYEVFLLMEYCSGGGLIDFMNTRLQHRLTEPEILKIFGDVATGVAAMHYLKPPLLHRDLKVENVLITAVGSSRIYKLCDFGSAAPPRPAAKTAAEGRLIEDDVQRHTTLQYRSPEMIDVYRKQPIDEKSDIWALGVLLYKLCYYTTPFEEQGQMAILNATFKFPPYPSFSDRIKRLISSMLRENPQSRPNIYQVLREVCSMRNRECPIKDIYSNRTESEDRRNQQLPSSEPNVSSPPVIGIHKSAPVQQVESIPDITPMRRGRPTAPVAHSPAAKPSPSPYRGTTSDPFAALDSQNVQVRSAAADELAARFPSLDEFSLLHDRGSKFQFNSAAPSEPKPEALEKRVTEALADDAFALPKQAKVDSAPNIKPSSTIASSTISRSASLRKPAAREPKEALRQPQPPPPPQPTVIHQPTPQKVSMVSTGIQTSPSPSPAPQKYPDLSKRPIYRFPPSDSSNHHNRTASQPRTFDKPQPGSPMLKPELTVPSRPSILDVHRSKSQTNTLSLPKSPASSRPSLEGSRPSALDIGDALGRSKSANARARPSSVHVESDLDFLREKETARSRGPTPGQKDKPDYISSHQISDSEPEKHLASDVDFLRSMEGDDSSKKDKHRRSSSQSKHSKRSSLPSISLSNTKHILAGKFGDAFRRFESNQPSEPRTPTEQYMDDRDRNALTPIAGSEATEETNDEQAIDETEDLPPEVRRELERRRLSQEEKRVAEAAAEYRKRLAEQGDGRSKGVSRASTIQNRVKSLLDDSKQVKASHTAEGYGHYTDTTKELPPRPNQNPAASKPAPPSVARKPVAKPPAPAQSSELAYSKPRQYLPQSQPLPPISASAPPAAIRTATGGAPRPNAPPKPLALRTGGAGAGQFDAPNSASSTASKPLPSRPIPSNVAEFSGDEDLDSFSKRYPSLSGLELVETEIGIASTGRGRTRDV